MLYHMDLGFPESLRLELPKEINLTWSRHAIKAAQTDRYGNINMFSVFKTEGAQLVEIEINDREEIVKIVLRKHYKNNLDICVAIAAGGVVKTVWLNEKNDEHKTLDKSKYMVV